MTKKNPIRVSCFNIKVITTKNDYDDFLQMLDYFNAESRVKISATHFAELPDMEATFNAVKEHGESAISILKKHRESFFEIDMRNEVIKGIVQRFAADLQAEVDNIAEKIESMSENNVNLCFAGVTSSGKSALINSILGYAILPERVLSETARMFRIQSPRNGEKNRIVFAIRKSVSHWRSVASE